MFAVAHFSAILAALIMLVCGPAFAQNTLPTYATVSTLAGSGRAGFDDGPAMSASFLMPAGIALDRQGNAYVADLGAHRIRKVDASGSVTTVAGSGSLEFYKFSTKAGYQDGPASSALFDAPTGIAVDAHGAIYVADAEGHAIRKIENGIVSTFAGNASESADRQGPLARARFKRPMSLAFDSKGDLFVADLEAGIREIGADGDVTVPAFDAQVSHPSAIALYEFEGTTNFTVADDKGILIVTPAGAQRDPIIPDPAFPVVHGTKSIGHPLGIAMLGPLTAIYTDPVDNVVRIIDHDESRVVAGAIVEDAAHRGGGYRDGPGASALFNGPFGIVADGKGGAYVAEANARRIRHLSAFDVRTATDPRFESIPATVVPKAIHVLLMGSSFLYWDTPWRESIPGIVEATLSQRTSRPVQVICVRSPGLSFEVQQQYVENLTDSVPVDYAMFFLNGLTIVQSYLLNGPLPEEQWLPKSTQALTATAARLPKNATRLALYPYSWELGPTENLYHRMFEKRDGEWIRVVGSYENALLDTAKSANLPALDLWSALAAADLVEDKPLYASDDPHFTFAGNAVVATAVANYIAADSSFSQFLKPGLTGR